MNFYFALWPQIRPITIVELEDLCLTRKVKGLLKISSSVPFCSFFCISFPASRLNETTCSSSPNLRPCCLDIGDKSAVSLKTLFRFDFERDSFNATCDVMARRGKTIARLDFLSSPALKNHPPPSTSAHPQPRCQPHGRSP